MTDFNAVGNIVYTKYVIARILYAYCTDEAFKKSVDEVINDPMIATVNDKNIVDTIWNLELRCTDVARQFVDAYDKMIRTEESDNT